jgi:hypothetical protein
MLDSEIDLRPAGLDFKLPGSGACNDWGEINRARPRAPVRAAGVLSSPA